MYPCRYAGELFEKAGVADRQSGHGAFESRFSANGSTAGFDEDVERIRFGRRVENPWLLTRAQLYTGLPKPVHCVLRSAIFGKWIIPAAVSRYQNYPEEALLPLRRLRRLPPIRTNRHLNLRRRLLYCVMEPALRPGFPTF